MWEGRRSGLHRTANRQTIEDESVTILKVKTMNEVNMKILKIRIFSNRIRLVREL